MNRTQSIRWLILLIASVASLNAFALTPEQIRIAIQGKMSERHPEKINEFWDKLGPEALPVLKQMYQETQNGNERGWLLDGMSHFDDASVATLLQSDIPKQEDEVLKRKQLSALIRSQGEAAYDFVEPYLDDEDPQIRKAVAQGLKQYGGSSKRIAGRLQDYLNSEKVPWVKDAVMKTQMVAKVQQPSRNVFAEVAAVEPSPTPLPQKNWEGEWRGVWITPDKKSEAVVNLVRINDKDAAVSQWRIELKLPKKSKMELKGPENELSVHQSAKAHWLEIRSKKMDAVFIAHRKAKE